VKRVEWNVEAFRLLVLPKPTKDLIQALVEIRASKDGMAQIMKRQDIISGKGQGLIMLLHGGPGTGKTLTAGMSHHQSDLLTQSDS
jgi:SpoVK/Ycf46/Vps4 family AAA+-type ATPase